MEDIEEKLVDYSFDNLKRNFPFPEMRGLQEDTLKKISSALSRDDVKFIVIQAPTGAGKSPMGMAIARSSESAYVLTANKMLQNQYLRDFNKFMVDFRGRSNYTCHIERPTSKAAEPFNCSNSPCRTTKEGRKNCAEKKACGFHLQREKAIRADITSMNFAAGLVYLNFGDHFGERNLMLVDEAHLIENQLTNFVEFNMPKDQIEEFLGTLQIPKTENPSDYVDFFSQIAGKLQEQLESDKDIDNYEDKKNLYYKTLYLKSEIIRSPSNIVVQIDDTDTTNPRYSFKPISVSVYADRNLFKYAKKIVLMSATIINYKAFCQSLGISHDEAVFIDVPSTFPKENRPIVKAYVGRLNMNNLPSMLPKIVERIKKIMDFHKDHKGIIHLPSYRLGSDVFMMIGDKYRSRILFPKNALEIPSMLKRHQESERPTVLMSPSMAEGIDLKEDLSRFQVIAKMPYPPMGDKVVKARMNKDSLWYSYTTALKLIQSYGRSVRSETDTAATYVLDEALEDVIQRNKGALPLWFMEALK